MHCTNNKNARSMSFHILQISNYKYSDHKFTKSKSTFLQLTNVPCSKCRRSELNYELYSCIVRVAFNFRVALLQIKEIWSTETSLKLINPTKLD